ncbi:DNA polymerase III subunit alpha [Thermosynechococcus sp. HN-54]|uniref:DNA polymerase III subunit alpha n=1 Tax=Thermosynechococcus sp. HN-54 TaxID=2933959 RepID=UPI00202CDD78|nr:DNA polymerase III subunit alpha [Thermosynechococcus sp. HN-54]URR34391.1 DNA polymerase III subunit alpha [Thermosynechococcus sp. HN-54]
MSFVGLHIHSDYSLLDGASQLPDLVARAMELGMPAIALTDHGVMYGAIELLKLCRGKPIKPIIGNEMYVINGDITKQERKPRFHQVVLAKNKQGYHNLCKLTTISHLQGFQGKGIFARPCINKELLAQYREGLIVTSACLGGEIPQAILQGKPDLARSVARWYQETFGDDFYLEIQDHGSQEDRVVNVELVRIGRELGIKIIATNDSHFISCNDVEAHDALLCIQTNKLLTDDKRMRYSGTEYLKSAAEMARLFRDHLPDEVIQEALANTLEVAEKVEPYNIFREPQSPEFPVPPGHTADTYLEQVAWQGLLERFQLSDRQQLDATYRQRLEYELKMLQQMGFSNYFLVVWDYIKYARDHNIPVGPGRGSAAGSLVAYALRITNIDPVHHGLLFERFLNPERKSMPDIDTDFCIDRREEVIQYVTQKYGSDRVAQIITFNRMTSKAVLKDVARVLDIPYSQADQMAKLIPVVRGKPVKLAVMISDETPSPEFKEKYESDPVVRRWIDMAMRIEGTNKTYGVHAAGVVIASEPLDQLVPLQRNNDGAVITQYFMEDLESLGLLKMDFLGLKNLTMIQKTRELIQKNHGKTLDLDALPLDDAKTYQILAEGKLEGIFQLESSGMRQIVRELKPSNLEDISSVLALYRPGPLDAGLIPKFINRKHGREPIQYQHELLKPILQETYGVLCLAKGTLIARPDGTQTPIEEIRAGDWVLSSDGQRVWPAKVAKQWYSGRKSIVRITLSSGTQIYCTPEHRFLTPAGDRPASELQPVSNVKNAHVQGSIVYEAWQGSKNQHSLNPNEAYLLGLFLGDGHLTSSSPNIACGTEEAATWVAHLIAKTWEGEPQYYFHGRCWYAYAKFKTQPAPTPFTRMIDTLDGDCSWKTNKLTGSKESTFLPVPSQRMKEELAVSLLATDYQTRKTAKRSLQAGLMFKPVQSNDAEKIAGWLQAYQDIYAETCLQDLRPVFVVAVEPWGEADCFDLEMADQASPYFLANGIVTHNCYQEQIMRMAQDLAGYSLGQADLLRRAMGKKKKEEMEKHEALFIEGAAKNGVPSAVAQELFKQMLDFAEYCLSGETAVMTVQYGAVPIRRLVQERLACQVYSLDPHGHLYTQPIAQWHFQGFRPVYEYELEDGSTICATPDHRFMTTSGQMLPIEQIFQEELELLQLAIAPNTALAQGLKPAVQMSR